MTHRDHNPFQVLRGDVDEKRTGEPAPPSETVDSSAERVRELANSANVFVFMKGSPDRPMCGFSANTVAVLGALDVAFDSFDVLSDESIRAAAKEFARWPTFPQVYVRGEFIGGNDIVTDMYHDGELRRLIEGSAA